jgi:hypothetical protein
MMMRRPSLLLALLLAVVVAAVPAPEPPRKVSAQEEAAQDDEDKLFAMSDAEFAEGTDETERDDEEDLDTEVEHVDEYLKASISGNISAVNLATQAPEKRGEAGMCVPACYRHGQLAHKPKVKCDRFICKACSECLGKPGSSLCRNEYTSMITRVKNGHSDIPNCGGKADTLDPSGSKCRLPFGTSPNKNAPFDVCDSLAGKCTGLLVSHTQDSVILKGPFYDGDIKTGSIPLKFIMCVK